MKARTSRDVGTLRHIILLKLHMCFVKLSIEVLELWTLWLCGAANLTYIGLSWNFKLCQIWKYKGENFHKGKISWKEKKLLKRGIFNLADCPISSSIIAFHNVSRKLHLWKVSQLRIKVLRLCQHPPMGLTPARTACFEIGYDCRRSPLALPSPPDFTRRQVAWCSQHVPEQRPNSLQIEPIYTEMLTY